MVIQSVSYNKSGEVRRYLEDICNAGVRDAAQKAAGGLLAGMSAGRLFHIDKGLAPAAGLARDAQGRIFVSDEFNHRILVYGADFALIKTIGSSGDAGGQLRYPRGLALDADGNLYVADAWNHRISVFASDLSFSRTIGKLGDKRGEMDEPCGVAIVDGTMYVLEKSNHRVQVFGLDGKSRGAIGKRGSAEEQEQFYLTASSPEVFNSPVFEYPGAIAVDKNGNLYVADTNNHRVVKIAPNGDYDSSFNPSGLRYPVGLACDALGNVHVTQFDREGALAISPEGVCLYRYSPPGIEIPVAISISGGFVMVAGGMKAAVSAMEFDSAQMSGAALEDEFSFHLRYGFAAIRAGKWDDAIAHMELAPEAADKSPQKLVPVLPENDFVFPDGAPVAAGALKGLMALLDGYCDALWKEMDTLMEAKLVAADENADVALDLERAILLGSDATDQIVVARFRSIKKVLGLSAAIKKSACAMKKAEELMRRFAHAGFGVDMRLRRMAKNLKAITAWKCRKEEWYNAAAKEAPSLSFNSLPDERKVFARNEVRIDLLAYEFRLLWGFAIEQNHELASLACGNGGVPKESLAAYVSDATDFFFFCPEDFHSRLTCFISLDGLFRTLGAETAAALAGEKASAEMWQKLGKEDNIQHETAGGPYGLLPALWGVPSLSASTINAESWEKITDFYHAEFRKFINENVPLRSELIRSAQMQPMAEKSDPKQSSILLRKLSLLRFHNLFQDRYIGNMMAEYLIRYALFMLKDGPIPKAVRQRTADELEKLFAECSVGRVEADSESRATAAAIGAASDISEKQARRVQQALALMALEYTTMLCAHLALMREAMGRADTTAFAQAADMGGRLLRPLFPNGAAFGEGGKLFLAATNGIFVFTGGKCSGTFGGSGGMEGRLSVPLDIFPAPNGELLVTQASGRTVSVFTQDGRFVRELALKGDEGRTPLRIQMDGGGRLFISFMDGGDIALYDGEGNRIGSVEKKGGALEYLENLQGFLLKDGGLVAGGNGRFTVSSIDGKETREIVESDIAFGTISSMCGGEGGIVYATDFRNGMILSVDLKRKVVSRIASAGSVGPSALAAKDGVLAVCDNPTHRILFIRP